MTGLDYTKILQEWETMATFIEEELDNIDTIFIGTMTGYEGGNPEFRTMPTTQNIRSASTRFKNAKTTIDKDIIHKEILEYYDIIFAQISTYRKRTKKAVDSAFKTIQTRTENPIVKLRHFSQSPKCAMLMNIIATDEDGSTDINRLQLLAPQYRELLDEMLKKSAKLWKDIIAYDEDTGKVVMSTQDKKDIIAVTDIIPPYMAKQVNDLSQARKDDKLVMLLALKETNRRIEEILSNGNNKISPIKLKTESTVADERIMNWLDTQINILSNRDIDEFEKYITPTQSKKLRIMDIFTGKDFVKADYITLLRTNILTKHELITAKLGIASITNYIPDDFEIEIVPLCAIPNMDERAISYAIADLKKFLGKDKVCYSDIIQSKYLLLSSTDSECRLTAYRIIAFIRYFYEWSKKELTPPFETLPVRWPWKTHITIAESFYLKKYNDKAFKYSSAKDAASFVKIIDEIKSKNDGKITEIEVERTLREVNPKAHYSGNYGLNVVKTK